MQLFAVRAAKQAEQTTVCSAFLWVWVWMWMWVIVCRHVGVGGNCRPAYIHIYIYTYINIKYIRPTKNQQGELSGGDKIAAGRKKQRPARLAYRSHRGRLSPHPPFGLSAKAETQERQNGGLCDKELIQQPLLREPLPQPQQPQPQPPQRPPAAPRSSFRTARKLPLQQQPSSVRYRSNLPSTGRQPSSPLQKSFS